MTPEDNTPVESKNVTDSIDTDDYLRLLNYAGSHVAAEGDTLAQEFGALGYAIMDDDLDADQLLRAHERAGAWFEEQGDVFRVAAADLSDDQDDLVTSAASIHYNAALVAKGLGGHGAYADHHRERLRWELNDLLAKLDELEGEE